MSQRSSKLNRETAETRVSVELDLDGQGSYEIDTGNGMFDHMLAQLSRHGAMDLKVSAQGDVEVGWHHLVEDVGIVLGRAMREAVGDARGITRMSHAYVPLDEALALAVVDFSGRGYAVIDSMLTESDLGGLSGSLIEPLPGELLPRGRLQPAPPRTGRRQQPPQGGSGVQGPRQGRQGSAHHRRKPRRRRPQHQGQDRVGSTLPLSETWADRGRYFGIFKYQDNRAALTSCHSETERNGVEESKMVA